MIIMAIIALAVLFIIIAIFTNVTEKTAENLGSCKAKGGKCLFSSIDDICPSEKPIRILVSGECEHGDEDKNNVCCFPAK